MKYGRAFDNTCGRILTRNSQGDGEYEEIAHAPEQIVENTHDVVEAGSCERRLMEASVDGMDEKCAF